jgi:NAD+ kinase
MISCDGRRVFDVTPGTTVTVRRGSRPVRVVRVRPQTFTERLVAKFALPVEGWRSNGCQYC